MRRVLICGAFGLLLAGCGSQPVTSTHHAYVVVQHLSGSWFERRVDFSAAEINGLAVMDQSGLQYAARTVTSGKVVCQVDMEPAAFSTCFPQNQPYWALFVESGGKWTSAASGVSDVKLHDGDAIGWHYVPADERAPQPPPLPKEIGR
jgi:hypothetical protein